MAGVLVIVCIPTENHEVVLRKKEAEDKLVEGIEHNDNDDEEQAATAKLLESPTSSSHGEPSYRSHSTNRTMKQIIDEILNQMKIMKPIWHKDDEFYQIIFPVYLEECRQKLYNLFDEWGIGERLGSWISVIPCDLFIKPENFKENQNRSTDEELKDQSAWNKFVSSFHARLNVAHIVEEVKQSATITFDFLTLLIVAGILAAFGLIEDSTIFLASSMLISPLMGPIIAATFGSVIKDNNLIKIGIVNEFIGIFIATSVGFIFGLIVCSLDEKYGIGEGLTNEMLTRCEMHALLVGVLTAIPSGAAVAISILSDNIGSLVGVAISASLLPPAVNTGLLWAIAILFLIYEKNDSAYNRVIKTNYYSDHQAVELAVFGAISMTITIINVICIYVMGFLFLKIKEVAPVTSKSQRQFWKYDVKVARDYNKTCSKKDGKLVSQDLAKELAELKNTTNVDVSRLLESINRPGYQYTWSPNSSDGQGMSAHEKSIKYLQELYNSISRPDNENWERRRSIIIPSSLPDDRAIISPILRPKFEDRVIFRPDRRLTMPFLKPDSIPPPKPPRSGGSCSGYMEKITEVSPKQGTSSSFTKPESPTIVTDEEKKPKKIPRKFTVTPAEDPLLKLNNP